MKQASSWNNPDFILTFFRGHFQLAERSGFCDAEPSYFIITPALAETSGKS